MYHLFCGWYRGKPISGFVPRHSGQAFLFIGYTAMGILFFISQSEQQNDNNALKYFYYITFPLYLTMVGFATVLPLCQSNPHTSFENPYQPHRYWVACAADYFVYP